MRAELDDRNEKLGFKVREAELQKVPIVAVVGDQEMQDGTVTPRRRRDKRRGAAPLALGAFAEELREAIARTARLTEAGRTEQSPNDDLWKGARGFHAHQRTDPRPRDPSHRRRRRPARRDDARRRRWSCAEEAGLDLVEVASAANPPVCRIMDYGKYKYEEKKKKAAGKTKGSAELKEVKLRPGTDEHDLNFKLKQARRFLMEGDKVKVTVMFRGREMVHREHGYRAARQGAGDPRARWRRRRACRAWKGASCR